MNLLSVAAAYGVVALVLQGGWAGQLIGIDTPTPLPAFVPVLMFAVLFGLSMDYEVFLVSRMREGWLRTATTSRRSSAGLAGTGRVITAAAAIMVAVFAAFIPTPDVVLKVIGVGMAAAIFIDATVVRLLLVPAVMHLLGTAQLVDARVARPAACPSSTSRATRRTTCRRAAASPRTPDSGARPAGAGTSTVATRSRRGRSTSPSTRPRDHQKCSRSSWSSTIARLLSNHGPRFISQRSGDRGTLPPSSLPVGRALPSEATLMAAFMNPGSGLRIGEQMACTMRLVQRRPGAGRDRPRRRSCGGRRRTGT